MKRKKRLADFLAAFILVFVVLSVIAAFFGVCMWLLVKLACALGLPRFAAPAIMALVAVWLALAAVIGGNDHDAP